MMRAYAGRGEDLANASQAWAGVSRRAGQGRVMPSNLPSGLRDPRHRDCGHSHPSRHGRKQAARTRAMAADRGRGHAGSDLGFARFAVVRHHSGRDAHRMARDHPVAVERIAVLAMALPATLVARRDHEPD